MKAPQFSIIYSTAPTLEQGLERGEHRNKQMKVGARKKTRLSLIYFKDPRGFDDRRLFLALGKTLGAVSVDVHTGKSLSVVIKHGDLPVLVFPPSITMHSVRLLGSLFFHDEFFPRASDYYKFTGSAQVSN